MKLLLEDLIPNRFYYCYTYDENLADYFKFIKIDKLLIYGDGYVIKKHNNSYTFCLNTDPVFCGVSYLDKCREFKEVSIEEFIDYLPNNNPDKKAYYRKNKIEQLLK